MTPEMLKGDTAPSSSQGSAESWIIVALCIGALIATVVFVSAPEIDLWASGLFYDPATERFPLDRAAIPLFFNDFIEWVALVLGLFSLFGLVYTGVRRRLFAGLGTKAYCFLVLSLITGPGLIANALFKENWGRARPRQITEFGSTQDFSPALVISDQCPSNCSFVSGDASMGFAVLCVALILPPVLWGLSRRIWIALAVAFGCFIGGIRLVQGAHFLSDVIFAGLFVSLAILLLKMIILDGRWGIADWVAKGFSGLGARLSGPMGLAHDDDARAWRTAHFAQLDIGGWRRALWVFFASRPRDFALPEPDGTNDPALAQKEGRSSDRPSELPSSDEKI